MAPHADEHLITITLTPQLMNHHRIKGQLKLTYKHMKEAFETGKGCIEFTNTGNVHYHIKTQDSISDIYVFLDRIKGLRSDINGKKCPIFGFVKCDKTISEDMLGNYDYLEKSNTKVDQTLKKLNLSDNYHSIWKYEKKQTRFNKDDCFTRAKQCLGNLDRIVKDIESDTEETIQEFMSKLV